MTDDDLLRGAPWRKSSYSGGGGSGGGDCVECAPLTDDRIALRDSKSPDGSALFFTRTTLAACVEGIKIGRIGIPTRP